ncbi:MAG TPA: amino acid adenylation domain-containing protein, partial [Ktedonobacteraceae bacterium]|nr:amino acid adenylation domain-containing protein [Ktedonobacteraceae bacterium]
MDISVGTPIANRSYMELEEVIGLFVNTLVMRTDLSGNPTFVELLKRVREVALGAYAHQDIPFEKVVEELEAERDLSRSPLFQVMFVFQNVPSEQEALPGVSVKPLAVESTISKFDLTLSIGETGQGLHCSLQYNTDLFEAETITRMLGHWQTLLEGVIQTPQARLFDLSLLTESEREQLLVKWNTTKSDSPQDRCVHQLFEQQVEQTPDAVALVFEEEVLTYAVLNRGVNQLAHYLQGKGVGPEVLVGICMERCLEMVVGLLAVLKTGGAYVPLDPTHPTERLAFIMTNAHVRVLLTQQRFSRQVPVADAQVITLEDREERLLCQPDQNPQSRVCVENQAYVIYTSGSTGIPKGVQVTYRGLGNLVLVQARTFAVGPGSRVLQFASLNFDVSILEILTALLSGASLHLERAERILPGPNLLQVLQEQAISLLMLTPSALAVLPTQDLPALQTLVVGGEACPVELMASWAVGRRFFNEYGPTETTVCASMAQCSTEQVNQRSLSLGQPLANTQIYLLDCYLQLVPIGVPGELFIGGIGLARGYLKRPDITAERFLPHPFSDKPGMRLYRTGDFARYQLDGTIEFLGRLDQQVKLRGYRIELGEIKAILAQHPAIQDCMVVLREDVPEEKRLVAYLVLKQTRRVPIEDLRSYLQDHLPSYMIPSALVMLDALPLTPNGKVDRRALPAPEAAQQGENEAQEGARTPIEELLVGIWSEVLGRRQVGIYEHFFELGGHSLLATRLMARVREVLQVEVPLRVVFERPTVATFAQGVQEALGKDEGMWVPPLVALERPEAIPLSFAQQRLWFLDQLEPNSTAYLIPSALRLQGDVNLAALQRSLRELVHRHESLRTTFEMRGPGPVQVIHPVGCSAVPLINLTGLSQEHREQEVQSLARQEAERPCDLEKGPLLRIQVVRLQAQEHVLLLTMHHIITDGWSNEVLVRELSTLYQAFLIGQSSPLAPLPIQYADYALWQREWLQGEVLEGQLAYWRKQLREVSPLALPTDHPRPAMQTHRGALQSL